MGIVELIFFPIMWVMQQILMLLHMVSGSFGLAIIGLSIVVRLLMTPISKIAAKAEEKDRVRQAAMAPALAEAKQTLSGRAHFEKVEKIYKEHSYHPIQSVTSMLPIALQIPFLLSALFLLVDLPEISGVGFLFLGDLGHPDGLISLGSFSINFLPILLTGIAVYESTIRKELTKEMRIRFLIVSGVIAILIYPLPAGVCLYWLTSNVWSLGATIRKNRLQSVGST